MRVLNGSNMNLRRKILKNKTIIENFSYLSVFQIFALLSPLITYPYLIRVVGLENYGVVIFAQALVTYFSLIINFGFNISGPRDVAICRNEHKALSEFVSSIYIIKFFLWALCLGVYMVLIFGSDFFHDQLIVYIFAFFITLNDVFFPIWFFQGIEKMKYITYVNLFVRSLFIIAVFIFIKGPSDYVFIPLLNSIGAIISGIISTYLVFKKESIEFNRVPKAILQIRFKEGMTLFISTVSQQVYLYMNKILIGKFLGMQEVTIYDLAEKITLIMKTLAGTIAQATFPKISREKSISYINKVMLLVVSLVMLIYLIIFFTSGPIVHFFTGQEIPMANTIIRILGLSAIFIAFNIFLGSNRLIPFGLNKQYLFMTVANSGFYLLIIGSLFICNFINIYSITVTYVIVEIFCFILLWYINQKANLLWSTSSYTKKPLRDESVH